MANPLLKFGSYTFPATFHCETVPTNRNIPTAKHARYDGARTLPGYLEGKTWRIKGGLAGSGSPIPTPGGTLRQQLDTLKAACNVSPTTFQTHDDRVWRNCQVGSFEESYDETGFDRYCDISFEVVTGDPFAYDLDAHSSTRSISASGQTLGAMVGGNAYALPQYQLTVGAAGVLSAQLAVDTTQDVFTLNGAVAAGDVLVVDAVTKTVTRQGDGSNQISLFDGIFARMGVGANTLTLTYTGGGATLSNLTVAWNNRYW